MAKEIDFDQLFARWGQPDERPCDDWFDAFFDAMRESGRLVAKHEWCGAYAGSNNIWLFKGAYFAENEAHMYGPFDTFWDAADAVDFDKVTDATTSIWVDKDIDMKGQSRPEYALPTKSPTLPPRTQKPEPTNFTLRVLKDRFALISYANRYADIRFKTIPRSI